jgi:hypothetical protein
MTPIFGWFMAWFIIESDTFPSGKLSHNYGKSPLLTAKSTIIKWQFSIANCKRLPEGK